MDSSEPTLFGALLKSFRQRRKLTQSALAYRIEKHNRGSIQAWEGSLYLPGDRETVLALARALHLTEGETDQMLLAAHYPQQYHTQGTVSSAAETRKSLRLADIYIYEHDSAPLLDITLHNSGATTALLTRVQVDILDAAEFYYCDEEEVDDPTRSLVVVSSIYKVNLSPALKGKRVSVKIAHQLRAEETDRFQLRVDHNFINPHLAYVWYYLKIALLYNEPGRAIELNPLLLSIPPVDPDVMDVWPSAPTPCGEQNRATLRRMSALPAYRSDSVEAAIQKFGEQELSINKGPMSRK